MKYGILYNKSNVNVGDDIQAFATARFLPHVDYFIDREHIDEFRSDDEEPVAVIMNAWYMWAKWNWPPSKYIVPKMIGFHYADHQLAKQPGSPFKYEFLEGIGGDYLKAYGPIGCRDEFTKSKLAELGIDAYFSGCITLTLPQMPETEDKGKYICLVDLEPKVIKRMQKILAKEDIEVRVITHNRERNAELDWESREKEVVDLLTIYQNARCVVTKRLHCALPCLALGTPVFIIKEMEDDIRFTPYYDFLYRTTVTKFMNGEYEYDFMNPPANRELYKPVREGLIKASEEFVAQMETETRSTDELVKTSYTEDEVLRWRHDKMKWAMDLWLLKYRELQKTSASDKKKIAKLSRDKSVITKEVEAKILKKYEDRVNSIDEKEREIEKLKKQVEMLTKESMVAHWKRKRKG